MDDLQHVLMLIPNLPPIYRRLTESSKSPIEKPTISCPASLTLKLIPTEPVAVFLTAYRNFVSGIDDNEWKLPHVSVVKREIGRRPESALRTIGFIIQSAMVNCHTRAIDEIIHPFTVYDVLMSYRDQIIEDENMVKIRSRVDKDIVLYCALLKMHKHGIREHALFHPTPQKIYRAMGWYV